MTKTMMETEIDPGIAAFNALAARDCAPEISEADDLYGWLAGSWELDVRHYRVDVTSLSLRGEVHAFRALEGRAVQDVWIMPARPSRHAQLTAENNMCGTTLRVWDASIAAWRITYINPVTGQRDELIGRRIGGDIVQLGTHQDGTPIRWIFTAINTNSFRWTGEALELDGVSWRLEGEFYASRIR